MLSLTRFIISIELALSVPLFFCLKSLSLSQLIPANGLFNPVHKPLKKLTEKFPDFKANIVGALRKDKFIYLKKNDQILEDDNVYVVVSSDQLIPILKAFGHEEKVSKNLFAAINARFSFEDIFFSEQSSEILESLLFISILISSKKSIICTQDLIL